MGLLKASDRLSILLDLDKLLSESEVTMESPKDSGGVAELSIHG